MFGFGKRKPPIKSVEDYIRTQETHEPKVDTGRGASRGFDAGFMGKLKPHAIHVAIALVALIFVIAVFSKMAVLSSEVASLKMLSYENKSLQLRIADLEAKLNTTSADMRSVQERLARQDRELEAAKQQQAAARAAAAKAKPKQAIQKKTPTKKKTATKKQR
jgi:hypothetical protein